MNGKAIVVKSLQTSPLAVLMEWHTVGVEAKVLERQVCLSPQTNRPVAEWLLNPRYSRVVLLPN